MAFSNDYLLNVDIKNTYSISTPTFRQGDNGTLRFKIFDGNKLFDLTGFTNAKVVCKLPSEQTFEGLATLNSKKEIVYELSPELETSEEGYVEVILSVYSGDSVVSVQPFNIYMYDNNLSRDTQDVNILKGLIQEVQVLKVQVDQAIVDVDKAVKDVNDLKAELQGITSSENQRKTNETARVQAETRRAQAETSRVQAESNRVLSEANREAQFNSNQATIDSLIPLVNNLESKGTWISTTAYKKNNVVELNGSSFIALQDNTGQRPPTAQNTSNIYWQLLARKGEEGNDSENYRIDNTKTLDNYPSDFLIGQTITVVLTNNTVDLYKKCKELMNLVLGYSLSLDNGTPYRFQFETVKKNNTQVYQKITATSNSINNQQFDIFQITRISNLDGSTWSDWKVNNLILNCKGNPNTMGIVGMVGWLLYDQSNNKLYKKTTGTISTITLGWTEIGAVSSVNGITSDSNGNVELSTNDIVGLNGELTNIQNSLNAHISTNASKTTKGHIQVGDGLSVSNGLVSANFYYDTTKTLDTPTTDFLNGETITSINPNASDAVQQSCIAVLNTLMGYGLTGMTSFRFVLRTIKRGTNINQEIVVYSNFSSSSGLEIMRFTRVGSFNSPYSWNDWRVNLTTISYNGNPNGVFFGLVGWLIYDTVNHKLYKKTTATISATATGWVEIGELQGEASGIFIAQSNSSYSTRQVRNIIANTTEPTTNIGSDGDIYIKYKA